VEKTKQRGETIEKRGKKSRKKQHLYTSHWGTGGALIKTKLKKGISQKWLRRRHGKRGALSERKKLRQRKQKKPIKV